MMRVSRSRRERRGASAVEMAFIAPIFVLMIMALLEASRLGMAAQLLTTAAREGARTAVLPGATQDSVQSRINSVLSGSGISVSDVTPTCPSGYTWNSAPGGTAITVSLSVPYKDITWLGTPYFLSAVNVSASATLSSENP